MNINLTLVGQLFTFAIFLYVISKYVVPPFMKAIDERQEKIAQGLVNADKAAYELEKATENSDAINQVAKNKSQEIIAAAEQKAHDIIEKAKKDARLAGERELAVAKSQIDKESVSAKDALRKQLSSLVIMAASQVIEKEVDAQKHSDLIEKLSKQL